MMEQYLSVPTHGAVDGRPFLGLAEEGIVWMAAPQLLAGVKCAVLWDTERGGASEESPENVKEIKIRGGDSRWYDTTITRQLGVRLTTTNRKLKR